MNDNKLIAEFMGYTPHPEDERFLTNKNVFGKGVIDTEECMAYHTSWDWLMPVVEKILDLSFQDDGDAEDFYNVRDCMPDINHTYKAVVEFIKTYNDEQQ